MSPEDIIHAKAISEISDYIFKPITVEKFAEIINVLRKQKD